MNSTLSHSTHVRATCNFNTDGLVTTDYLRAKTTDLNILQLDGWPCAKMEYINIRGYHCKDCWARIIHEFPESPTTKHNCQSLASIKYYFWNASIWFQIPFFVG